MYDEKQIIEGFKSYLKHKRPETINTYEMIIKQFLQVINKPVDKINKKDFEKWQEYCTKFHNNSLTPKYGAVKKFIDYLIDEEILDETMYGIVRRRLKAPKMQLDKDDISHLVLQPKQFDKVFEVSKKNNFMHYALFKTMYWVQARRCEIIGLKINDINFVEKIITFRGEIAKGGKKATVNISQECLDILKEYIDNYRGEARYKEHKDILFLRECVPISRTKIWELHKYYSELLGFRITPHMWRHTGITEYAKVEKDLEVVRRQARHDDINITRRYINYGSKIYEKSYHEKFAKDKPKEEIPEPQPEIKKPQPKPQDTYIANPQEPQQVIVSAEEYKKFLEFKKQQEISTAYM